MAKIQPELLVDTASLEVALGDPALRVFDCTVHLVPDPPGRYRVVSGREGYGEAHVPGAGFHPIYLGSTGLKRDFPEFQHGVEVDRELFGCYPGRGSVTKFRACHRP